MQYGGTPVKVNEDDYHLFRESEYVFPGPTCCILLDARF